MSLLDNAIEHFGNSVDAELRKVDVPEWNGSVWFKVVSSMNGTQYQQYFKAAQKADFDSLVDILILRAKCEDGTKMFTQADRKTLMYKVAPDVITSIVNAMTAIDTTESEGVKKS